MASFFSLWRLACVAVVGALGLGLTFSRWRMNVLLPAEVACVRTVV